MPTETTEMLTLQAMQKTATADLRSIALHSQCRFYAIAADQMAQRKRRTASVTRSR